jgi:hypothetical protein
MNDQPNSQAPNVTAELRSNVLSDEDYSIVICDNSPDYPIMGFLQLCADRRFHQCIQEAFRDDSKLDSPQKYWIHADAGGTPKMTERTTAPRYCYDQNDVRLMGWSAHGNGCGGFPPGTEDKVIEDALYKTIPDKIRDYPEATHFVYFARAIGIGKAAQSVLYCLKYEKGQITTRKG